METSLGTSFAALLAALPIVAPLRQEERPVGDLLVRGTVVDVDGVPVDGAEVRAGPMVTDPHLDWIVIPFESRLRPADASAACVTTGPDGAFVLHVAPCARLHLAVRHAGFATRNELHDPDSDPSLDLGTVVIRPGVPLRGRVVDRDGTPIAGVELLRRGRNRLAYREELGWEGVLAATSGPDGRFLADTLAPVETELEVSAPGFVPQRHTIEPAALSGQEWCLVLERAVPITGRVVGATEGLELAVSFWSQLAREQRTVPCRPDGSFRIDGLSPEHPAIQLRALRRVTSGAVSLGPLRDHRSASPLVTVVPGSHVVLDVPEPLTYRFRAVDAHTGETLSGVHVGLLDGLDIETPPEEACTEEGGVVQLRLRRPQAEDFLALAVRHPGHERVALGRLPFHPGEITDLGSVPLEPLRPTFLRILDAAGTPVDGVNVTAGVETNDEGCLNAHFVTSWPAREALPGGWSGVSATDGTATAYLSRGPAYWIHVEDPRFEEFWQRVETLPAVPAALELRLTPR